LRWRSPGRDWSRQSPAHTLESDGFHRCARIPAPAKRAVKQVTEIALSAATLSKTQPLPENASFAAGGDDVPLTVRQAATLGCQRPNSVSLGRAKADSPSPRDGPKHPVLEIGSRALPRNIQAGGGNCQDRVNTIAPHTRARMARPYGWSIETGTEGLSGNQRTRKTGRRPSGNCGVASRPGTTRSSISSAEETTCERACGSAPQTGVLPGIRSWASAQMTLRTIFRGAFRLGFNSRPLPALLKKIGLRRRQSTRNCGPSPYAERRGSQEAASLEPMFRGRVSIEGEGPASASLYDLVRAAADRVSGARNTCATSYGSSLRRGFGCIRNSCR